MSEVSLDRVRPRARLGTWRFLLSQNGKDGCRGLPEGTRGKQAKAPNRVPIVVRNVPGPTVNEFFE